MIGVSEFFKFFDFRERIEMVQSIESIESQSSVSSSHTGRRRQVFSSSTAFSLTLINPLSVFPILLDIDIRAVTIESQNHSGRNHNTDLAFTARSDFNGLHHHIRLPYLRAAAFRSLPCGSNHSPEWAEHIRNRRRLYLVGQRAYDSGSIRE
jgi:hypothetical protein